MFEISIARLLFPLSSAKALVTFPYTELWFRSDIAVAVAELLWAGELLYDVAGLPAAETPALPLPPGPFVYVAVASYHDAGGTRLLVLLLVATLTLLKAKFIKRRQFKLSYNKRYFTYLSLNKTVDGEAVLDDIAYGPFLYNLQSLVVRFLLLLLLLLSELLLILALLLMLLLLLVW